MQHTSGRFNQSLTSLLATDGDYINTTPGRSHRHCIEFISIKFMPDFTTMNTLVQPTHELQEVQGETLEFKES